jgi:hypothetical protein
MLRHRFIDELKDIETNRKFCGRDIVGENRILIIGTFNPDSSSYPVESNNAKWFYGRTNENYFWDYFPRVLTGESLHPRSGFTGGEGEWRKYCATQKVVIIDMIKEISSSCTLTSQKDRGLENQIKPDLSNVRVFECANAFSKSTFNLVIYSLAWTDYKNLPSLIKIRDSINSQLQRQGTIDNMKQIRYCKAPWRNDSFESWNKGLTGQ